MYLSEDFFIYFKSNAPILWNFKTHEQYELDREHLNQLINLSEGGGIAEEFVSVFKKTGLLNEGSDSSWNWDILSKIFHVGTKNIPISTTENISPEKWVKEYLEFCDEIGPEPLKIKHD